MAKLLTGTRVYGNATIDSTLTTANLVTTTNTVTIGTASYFVANGNLGVGTSSPAAKLEVNGGIISRAIASEGGEISFNNPDNASVGLYVDVAAADTGRIFQVRNNSQIQIGQLTGTGGIITLHTEASERVRVAANGNVGIGTSSAGERLVVQGSTTNVIAQIRNSSTAASFSKTTAVQFIGTDTVGTAKETGDIFVVPGDNNYVDSNMLFYTRGSDAVTERMRIDSSGNVGIGTSSPNAKLGLTTTAASAAWQIRVNNSGVVNDTGIYADASNHMQFAARNGSGTLTVVLASSGDSYLNGGNVGIGNTAPNAKLQVTGTANVSGNVVIGGTSATFANTITVSVNNTTGGGIILADDGDIVDLNDAYCSMRFTAGVKIYSGNRTGSARILLGADGAITANSNITAYGNASDINLKENIVRIENALDKVCKLGGYHFNYIGKTDKLVGVIAQEVQEVFPELVYKYNTENDDESIAVRYSHITAVLIEAIKEQQVQIAKLREEITSLKQG